MLSQISSFMDLVGPLYMFAENSIMAKSDRVLGSQSRIPGLR